MKEGQYSRSETYEPIKGFKKFLGIILIAAGAIIALWAIINIYYIFTNPQQLEVFKQIIPDSPKIRELDIDGKKVILPEGVFLFMSYGIGCFLLFIAAMIGTGFITGGVNLLMSSYQRLEAKINKEIGNLKKKIDEAKALIMRKSDSE